MNNFKNIYDTYTNMILEQNKKIHIVKKGQVLSKIAKQYNVSVQSILNINNIIDRNRLKIGQKIIIPIITNNSNNTIKKIKVLAGDNYYKIAKRYNTTVNSITQLNPNVDPTKLQINQILLVKVNNINKASQQNNLQSAKKQPINLSNQKFKKVKVLAGDNYQKIAKRQNTTAKEILKANKNIDPRKLQVGQIILVPLKPEAIGKIFPSSQNQEAKQVALSFIKKQEGTVKLNGSHVVYDDANNKRRFNSQIQTLDQFLNSVQKVPTIGYGCTDLNYIKQNNGEITDQQANQRAKIDILDVCNYMPRRFGNSWNCLNKNQRAAIISFFYQQGKDQTKNPNVEKLIKAVQQNKLDLAVNFIKSETNSVGILNRRQAQRQLYLS